MDKELTITIISLCGLITKKIEQNNKLRNEDEIIELTKALAELVSAKANVFGA